MDVTYSVSEGWWEIKTGNSHREAVEVLSGRVFLAKEWTSFAAGRNVGKERVANET